MEFTPLDMNSWPRAGVFCYFYRMAPTGYSITLHMDVTRLRRRVKEAGLKFFPVYLWLVTGCLNEQEAFKMAIREGQPGYYDTLTPLYASFHPEDHTFSLMWTRYDEDFSVFYRNYCENQRQFGDNRGILCQPQTPPPENAYTVSCVPWVEFSHFAVHSYENKPYFFPSVESGKFFERDGKIWMPLSLTCHHAATDGYHIHVFQQSLQRAMDRFGGEEQG